MEKWKKYATYMSSTDFRADEKMKKKCDVIVPVYNSPEWLALCIEAAIVSDRSGAIGQILLIDDCSGSETKELIDRLCAQYKRINCVHNEQNLGFVKSCNRGMSLTKSDYIMLLNSDCLLADDTTAKLIKTLEKYKTAGLISPLSNNAANLSISIPLNANYVQVDKILSCLPDERYPACTVVGNCIIITRDCYETMGGLDEAFGMGYGEETDYQFRAAEAGFDALVAGNVYVFHKSQVSFGNSEVLNERKKKNRELFFARWGTAYHKLLSEYEKHDPAKIAECYLNENAEGLRTCGIDPFTPEFMNRVKCIDTEQQNSDNSIFGFNVFVAKFKELGFREVCKKILAKIRLSGSASK